PPRGPPGRGRPARADPLGPAASRDEGLPTPLARSAPGLGPAAASAGLPGRAAGIGGISRRWAGLATRANPDSQPISGAIVGPGPAKTKNQIAKPTTAIRVLITKAVSKRPTRP